MIFSTKSRDSTYSRYSRNSRISICSSYLREARYPSFQDKEMSLVHEVLCLMFFTGSDEPSTRCKSMSNNFTFVTAGGRICCTQCQAKSKRTQQQCRAPATKGKTKCRFHGGASTGPKTAEGRQHCAEAKTIHSKETRKARTERTLAMRQLRALEELGHALGIMEGARTPGRKPS